MSAVLTRAASAAKTQALRLTQGRVLLSEFTKFRSLRSTVWTLLVAVVLVMGLGSLISAVTASQHHAFDGPGHGPGGIVQPITTSLSGITSP